MWAAAAICRLVRPWATRPATSLLPPGQRAGAGARPVVSDAGAPGRGAPAGAGRAGRRSPRRVASADASSRSPGRCRRASTRARWYVRGRHAGRHAGPGLRRWRRVGAGRRRQVARSWPRPARAHRARAEDHDDPGAAADEQVGVRAQQPVAVGRALRGRRTHPRIRPSRRSAGSWTNGGTVGRRRHGPVDPVRLVPLAGRQQPERVDRPS